MILLMVEYSLFLGYILGSWNHLQYIFITFTFVALAYKTILCWPLMEFEKVLKNPGEGSSSGYFRSGLLASEVGPAIEDYQIIVQ